MSVIIIINNNNKNNNNNHFVIALFSIRNEFIALYSDPEYLCPTGQRETWSLGRSREKWWKDLQGSVYQISSFDICPENTVQRIVKFSMIYDVKYHLTKESDQMTLECISNYQAKHMMLDNT